MYLEWYFAYLEAECREKQRVIDLQHAQRLQRNLKRRKTALNLMLDEVYKEGEGGGDTNAFRRAILRRCADIGVLHRL
jgi:hypothetical protein